MSPFIEDLLERPVQQRIGIFIGSLVIVGLLLWANLFSPNHVEYLEVHEKLEALKNEANKERRLAMNLEQYKKEVRDLDVQLDFALQELPDKSEIPELLSSVSGLAKEAGLDVNLFKVNAERLDEFYARVPVEIAVTGSYHQVASFFDAVSELPRIVNISQIEMTSPNISSGSVILHVNCVATTFRYITPEEQARVQGQSDQHRRR